MAGKARNSQETNYNYVMYICNLQYTESPYSERKSFVAKELRLRK